MRGHRRRRATPETPRNPLAPEGLRRRGAVYFVPAPLNRLPYPPKPSLIIEPNVTETYTYDGVGGRISKVVTRVENIGAMSDNTQPTFEYNLAYDALGDVTSRTYPNCSYVHCSEATSLRTVAQGFTEGLLTSITDFASSITYHPDGLWARVVHSNGVTDYQDLDDFGMARPGRLHTSGADQNFDSGSYAYDGAGNVTEMGSDRYVYDLLSRVQEAEVEVPHKGCGLENQVSGTTDTVTKTYRSCGTVKAGPSYTVGPTGNVTLKAGHEVVLASGVTVASGGRLTLATDPTLDPGGQPTAAGQTYTVDRFGNLTQVVTSHEGQVDPPRTIGTFSNTNRLSSGGYDGSGNLTSLPGVSWSYDPFNMMTLEVSSSGSRFDFVYGPGDERIWTIEWSSDNPYPSNWRETWTLRDLDGSPLRQYVLIGGNYEKSNWQAAAPDFPRDYAWRGGSLLASVSQANVTRHFHLDHLGSPQIVTDADGKTLDLHLYFPFGEEATDASQDNLSLKFTGHERDDLDPYGTSYDLDYMHARYFSAHLGRFLSVDPSEQSHEPRIPQSWNRYAYVRSNPISLLDPDGKNPFDFRWLLDAFSPGAHPIHDTLTGVAHHFDSFLLMSAAAPGLVQAPLDISLDVSSAVALRDLMVREAPEAESPALQKVVRQLFKASDRFPGGTAGALRVEAATGRMLSASETGHVQAGLERLGNLRTVLGTGGLSSGDVELDLKLQHDITNSLELDLQKLGYTSEQIDQALATLKLPK